MAMVGISCYILADTYFISVAEGADGLTALNLVLPIYSMIFAIGSMTGTGAATRFAIMRARKDDSADTYFTNSIFFALIFGGVFATAGLLFPDRIIGLMGGDERITAIGEDYTMIFMLFAPFFMLNYICTSFVQNDRDPSLSMAATLTSSLSNILLDYIFMFPLGMGMRGAALATGISPIISLLICSIHFFKKSSTIKVRPHIPSLRLLLRSWQLGIPAFVGEISSGVTTTIFNFLILGLAGNAGVAAYGVITNFALVGTSVFNGVASGSQPLISRFYGEGELASANRIRNMALITAESLAALMLAAVLIFAEQFTALFNSENSDLLAHYANSGMRLYFIGFLFSGFNIASARYLSATERAASSFIASFLRGFAAVAVCAFVLSAFFGLTGVWLTFPAAELLTAVFTVFVLLKRPSKKAPL